MVILIDKWTGKTDPITSSADMGGNNADLRELYKCKHSITLLYFKRGNLIPFYKHFTSLYGLFELKLGREKGKVGVVMTGVGWLPSG